jgi:hypothetical protein
VNTAWTEPDLAYLAGILDGEGCITLCQVGRSRYSTQIFIANTDERLVHWVHSRFGGSIALRRKPKDSRHKPLWMWLLSGPSVEPFLTAVLPYLVLKHEQASLLLEYRKTVTAIGTNNLTPTHIVENRERMKSRLSVLNRRGIA